MNQHCGILINQVENAVDYTLDGDTPYTPAQVAAIALQLLLQTGLFNDSCKL